MDYMKMYIVSEGKDYVILNSKLIEKQNLSEAEIDKLLITHKERMMLHKFMEIEDNVFLLRQYDKLYTELEFKLQSLWKFNRDASKHRFWKRPKCSCPKLDNEDRYGTNFAIYSGNCILHGGE